MVLPKSLNFGLKSKLGPKTIATCSVGVADCHSCGHFFLYWFLAALEAALFKSFQPAFLFVGFFSIFFFWIFLFHIFGCFSFWHAAAFYCFLLSQNFCCFNTRALEGHTHTWPRSTPSIETLQWWPVVGCGQWAAGESGRKMGGGAQHLTRAEAVKLDCCQCVQMEIKVSSNAQSTSH